MRDGTPITTLRSGDQDPLWEERRRRQEIRFRFLAPICVMWTPDVPPHAAQAAVMGVRDALKASGQIRELSIFGASQFAQGDYSSAQWYVTEAYKRQQLRRNAGYGPQLDIGQFTPLFTDEPWQADPHWEVLIVNQDLNSMIDGKFINFVFGATNLGFPYSVQSVSRLLSSVRDPGLQTELIRRVLRHEVGHMFGLPIRDNNTIELLGKHCANVCTMREGLSVEEWASQLAQENSLGLQFCGDCLTDFERARSYPRPLSELPEALRRSV